MTEDFGNLERTDPATRTVVSELLAALATALGAAAVTVAFLAWVSTWRDVGVIGPVTYFFWTLAVTAVTLRMTAWKMDANGERH